MMGLGIMTGESLNLGMIGMFGDSNANKAVEAADTLIIIGARVGERSIPDPQVTKGKDIIHADIDPAELGKNIIPTIPIVSDCKSFLQKADELFSEPISLIPWTKRSNISTTADKLTEYLKVLAGYARPGTVIAADVGNNQIAASKIRIKDGVFITSGGMGTMGYGLPAAIGALKADDSRDVICISGDGGFQMSMAELATVKAYSLPVQFMIINDSSLGMVRDAAQKIGYGDIAEGFSTDLSPGNPDFAALAKSYGIASETVRDYNTDSIKRLLESKSAYLIDLVI
jgi:acetolactate synthase-1/2/3 large subunit